ncbi:unnamed protein product, partial [Prorocentrum cordatum]
MLAMPRVEGFMPNFMGTPALALGGADWRLALTVAAAVLLALFGGGHLRGSGGDPGGGADGLGAHPAAQGGQGQGRGWRGGVLPGGRRAEHHGLLPPPPRKGQRGLQQGRAAARPVPPGGRPWPSPSASVAGGGGAGASGCQGEAPGGEQPPPRSASALGGDRPVAWASLGRVRFS